MNGNAKRTNYTRRFASVAALSMIFIIAYGILRGGRFYGPLVLASSVVPIFFFAKLPLAAMNGC